MYRQRKVLAIIPAREGSKRIPGKNIKLLAGKPLIWYTISSALQSRLVDRVIVSTDSASIVKIAKRCGAEAPFLRPVVLAADSTPTVPVIQHAVNYLREKEGYQADVIVLLQPTSPLVASKDIDEAIKKLITTRAHSCVSVSPVGYKAEWIYALKDGFLQLSSVYPVAKPCSHAMSPCYRLNGAVYALAAERFKKSPIIVDKRHTVAIIMPPERSVDIDEPFEFALAEFLLKYAKQNNNRQ